MKDERDIETIEDGDEETEAAAKALTDAGDEAGALRLKLERAEKRLKRERDLRRQGELVAVKAKLAAEFEYADPDLIVGRTEAEMRASAERAHNAVAKVIASKGFVKSNLSPEETEAAQKLAKLKDDFGAPPPVATEAVSGEAPMEWAELQEKARSGGMSRAEVLANVKADGARRIERPRVVGPRARGEQKQTA